MNVNELSVFTIRGTLKAYKAICPNSPVSEAAIRQAIKDGSLKARQVGNTNYVLWKNFLNWLGGDDDA